MGCARRQLYEYHVEQTVRYGSCLIYRTAEDRRCDCGERFDDPEDSLQPRSPLHHARGEVPQGHARAQGQRAQQV